MSRSPDHAEPASDLAPMDYAERARELHRTSLVIDGHADTPTEFFLLPDYDFGARHDEGHIDLPRMRDGGLDAEFFIAWVPAELAERPGASLEHAVRLIRAIHEVVRRTPGVRIATDADGVSAAAAANEVAALIGVEGGHAIENSLDNLRWFHELGVRYMTLTWNNTHDWADACCSPPRHGGLTEFGRAVVREMNRLGMLVDVSHLSDAAFWHVIDTSDAPVIASHSCARALTDHPRNLTDDQLRAIAASGGWIGVNFFPAFLDDRYSAEYFRIEAEAAAMEERLRREYGDQDRARAEASAWCDAARAAIPPVPIDTLVDHIEHIANTAGIDHVGLGSDFDGIKVLPSGIRHAGDLPRITELLLQRGFDDDALRKLLGTNFLRMIRTVAG